MRAPDPGRRAVLRGIGATLALPFLPSLAWAEDPRAPARPPRRFVSLVAGDGFHPSGWWARAGATGLELGPTLASLAPYRDRLAVCTGLGHPRPVARVHGYGFTTMLSCVPAPAGRIRAGVSLDQLLAQAIGRQTAIPSLVMGLDPVRPGTLSGSPALYHATCSWRDAATPIPPEHLPQQIFRRLFDLSTLRADRSVLDFVAADRQRTTARASTTDRRQLDAYFTSLRELEQELQRLAADPGEIRDADEPGPGVPPDRREHHRLLRELLVLALRTDRTRIATLVLLQDFSAARFAFLDGVGSDGHHATSHHGGDQARLRAYRAANAFHVEQVAALAARLAQETEADGSSLLDHTLILCGSCMGDGDGHDRGELPLALLGGRSHGLRGGLVHDCRASGEVGDLHLTIARRHGLAIERVGEGDAELPGIFAP